MKPNHLILLTFALLLSIGTAKAQNDEGDAFRELALRSLTYPGAPAEDLRLYPNALPDDFPIHLTYPDSTRLIGTIQRPYETTVFITSKKSAADIMRYYYDYFLGAGWQTQEWPRWGFASAADAYPNTYCNGEQGPWLNLMAMDFPDQDTDLRITMNNPQGPGPCAHDPRSDVGDFPPMPFLTAPEGATMTSTGQGGGQFDEVQASATMETTLSLEDLAHHFIPQLERAGWEQADAGADGATLWRTYRTRDQEGQPWTGQFFLTRLPGQDRVTAVVIASKEGNTG